MINFNIPPFTGKETEYMTKAIQNHKISGDGEFTKKCNKWIEDKTGTYYLLHTRYRDGCSPCRYQTR